MVINCFQSTNTVLQQMYAYTSSSGALSLYQRMLTMLWFLLLLTVFIQAQLTASCGSNSIHLNGAGTLFLAPIFKELGLPYSINRSFFGRNVKFDYLRTSSEHGIKLLLNSIPGEKPIVFAATMEPLSAELQNRHPTLRGFPILAGALLIVFNVPGVDELVFNIADLAAIYNGSLEYWNDQRIQEYNPGAKLPFEKIVLVARQDTDRDTYTFTSALSEFNPDWAKSYGTFTGPEFRDGVCCNSTTWPANRITYYGQKAIGLAGIVASIPYTIGFAALADTEGISIKVAGLINAFGKTVKPDAKGIQAAMDYHLENTHGSSGAFQVSNALDENSYPMAAFAYLYVNVSTSPELTCCQLEEFMGFLDWLFYNPYSILTAERNNVVKLSGSVANEVFRSTLRLLTCKGQSVYDTYLSSTKLAKGLETWQIIMIAVGALAVTLPTVIGSIVLINMRQNIVSERLWLIESNQVEVFSQNAGDSASNSATNTGRESEATTSSGHRTDSTGAKNLLKAKAKSSKSGTLTTKVTTGEGKNPMRQFFRGHYDDHAIQLNELTNIPPPNLWRRATKNEVLWMKADIVNPNLMLMIGLINRDGIIYSMFDAAGTSNGSLRNALQNVKFDLTDAIKYNLICGVADGMRFLHRREITHGLISSVTLYIDSTWAVRIGHWEMYTLYMMEGMSEFYNIFERLRDYSSDTQALVPLIYFDPAMIHNRDTHVLAQRSMKYDIYSFGLLLVEVFTRKIPFSNETYSTTYEALIERKFDPTAPLPRPHMEGLPDIPQGLIPIIESCMVEPAITRPSFMTLYDQLMDLNPSAEGIIDMMMQTMESYMDNMEGSGKDLNRVRNKMEDLLNAVLPRQIAEKLFHGEVIQPEYFPTITVFFSSVHGFAELSQRSSPQDVMGFLNDLWIMFDGTVDQFDVYKADTIGDCYMVCSGLPARNGTIHVREISRFALAILDKCQKIKMKQNDQQCVMIKIGINSGPAIAGVIGTKMPQYCIFGDTVNTASRMSSCTKPGKVQLSESTRDLLCEHYAEEFFVEYRGDVDIKGKGTMKTYWLIPPVSFKADFGLS